MFCDAPKYLISQDKNSLSEEKAQALEFDTPLQGMKGTVPDCVS